MRVSALSLEEAKDHLGITSEDYDTKLVATIATAEAAIAMRVGPLEPTPTTSVVDCGGDTLTLPLKPVISLTSVTATVPFGSVTIPTDLVVNGETGVVTSLTWYIPAGRYTATYVAGYDTLPADLVFAIKEMVRHLWAPQRGGGGRVGAAQDQSAPGYLIPNRVAELLAPHKIYGFGLV